MSASVTTPSAIEPMMMYGGAFHPAAGGETFESANPMDSSVLAHVPLGDERDAVPAVDAAVAAFGPWSRLSAAERARHLHRMADRLEARRGEVALLITREE